MIVRNLLARASHGRLSILIFHRVLRDRDPLFPTEPAADDFDALLAHLKERFSVLPPQSVTNLFLMAGMGLEGIPLAIRL